MKVSLILACAGKGERVGANKNKLLLDVGGGRVLDKTISAFTKTGFIDEYIIVCSETDFNDIVSLYGNEFKIALGGKTRTQSIKNALPFVTGDIVLIHDGARPNVSIDTIYNCIEGARKNGSAIATIPSRDTVCKVEGEKIINYLGKSDIYLVQTPQAFLTEKIKTAYANIGENDVYNDDGEVYQKTFGELFIASGNDDNIKVTYKKDIDNLACPSTEFRFGTGFDCHQLVEGRKLILGGVEIPHTKGLLGHSDADVLTHAIMDALLSGAGLKDIGYYFPDIDQTYKDANSIELLKQVVKLINEVGFAPLSISAVIMAQKPKLLPHIKSMVDNLALVLGIDSKDIGIGATTLEGLGFVGREKGICVNANAVLKKS